MSLSSSSPPPNNRRRIKSCSYFGPPSTELSEKETLRFLLRNFKNLKEKNGESLESDPQEAHNHLWALVVHPRGHDEDTDGQVCFFLRCMDASGTNPVNAKVTLYHFGEGYRGDTTHSNVVKNCLDSEGNLVIDVDIQVYVEKKLVWYPKKTGTKKRPSLGRQLLSDSNIESDVTLLIGTEPNNKETFHAHRCILFHRAPVLYDFIKNVPQGDIFELTNVNPTIFKILLEYIYTDDIPEDLIKTDDNMNVDKNEEDDGDGDDVSSNNIIVDFAKDLLLASNRFGLVDLKLYIESDIIAKLLQVDNAAEWLSIADAQICPLLKEECMKIFWKDKAKFKSSDAWKQIKESSDLLEELLDFTDCTVSKVANDNDYDNMSVRSLREQLDLNDLDLDGTKEMLIQRLKAFHQQKQNPSSDKDNE